MLNFHIERTPIGLQMTARDENHEYLIRDMPEDKTVGELLVDGRVEMHAQDVEVLIARAQIISLLADERRNDMNAYFQVFNS